MKKILLISDTHGYVDEAMLRHVQWADEVWHAGDWGGGTEVHETLSRHKPLRGVYGNIDDQQIRQLYPEVLRFTCESVSVLMVHIGGYPAHFPARIKGLLQKEKPQLFICGHSHILRVMRDQALRVLCMNPGAAGISGFHKKRTMLRFVLHEGQIQEVAVIELGDRGALPEQ
jgi:uncharacterized protein